MDFDYDLPRFGGGSPLVVFSEGPGTGKSTLADAIGRKLKAVV
jgi:pantothenate kinase-related protein Tda10